jgi:toxin ParE1/3/4
VRFRLSRLAEFDVAHILATSEERWGTEARRRYEAIIATAMRKVAIDPTGPATRDRAELSKGIRSLHLRYARDRALQPKVAHPVHVLYYRMLASDLIEIVRVLHERMDPNRHLSTAAEDEE